MTFDFPVIDAHVALGNEGHYALAPEELLRDMDAHGISIAIARPMGRELAIYNARGNDRCLGASRRIRAVATASPWLETGVEELRRAKHAGAVGLYLHPTRQGFMPTDDVVRPLIETARGLAWPVVFHTGTYVGSDVLAVAELARRHRDVTFLCDCAGYTDMWFELPGLMAENPNLHLIASLIWPRAIGNTVKNFGAARVLFGSGAPRDSVAAALARIERLELPEADARAILHDNAARIFGL